MTKQDEWVRVFRGEQMEVTVLQAKLEAHGIPTSVPGDQVQAFDPFIRGGGSAFQLDLLVPSSAVESARPLLETRAEEEPDGELDGELVPGPSPLERLGRRIQFAALIMPLAPYGLWLAPRYLAAASEVKPRPPGHRFTLAAVAMCAAWTAVFVMMLAS